jgi:hypothetical protein
LNQIVVVNPSAVLDERQALLEEDLGGGAARGLHIGVAAVRPAGHVHDRAVQALQLGEEHRQFRAHLQREARRDRRHEPAPTP